MGESSEVMPRGTKTGALTFTVSELREGDPASGSRVAGTEATSSTYHTGHDLARQVPSRRGLMTDHGMREHAALALVTTRPDVEREGCSSKKTEEPSGQEVLTHPKIMTFLHKVFAGSAKRGQLGRLSFQTSTTDSFSADFAVYCAR